MEYRNGKIYRLVSDETGEQYVGSTTQPLSKRKSYHKARYNFWKAGKGEYYTSFKIIGTENYDIVLIEDYPCNSKEQLHARERFWIETIEGGCVNRAIPTQTPQEYYQAHRQHKLDYAQEYRTNNKTKINDYAVQYRTENRELISQKKKEKVECECRSVVCKNDLSKHKKTKKHLTKINIGRDK